MWKTLVIAILGALAGGWLLWSAARIKRRAVMGFRRRRGQRGEELARGLLEQAGYRIADEQSDLACELLVDGQPRPYHVRADYLVTRGDQRFVAEVKTGRQAPNPVNAATRRQLLEYATVYDADGVLLVDMEAAVIHRVGWPRQPPREAGGARHIALAGGVLGLLLGLLLGWLLSQS